MFVIERVVHASTGISTVWHSSFLPSGYGGGLARGTPSPASLAGTQEGDDRLFPPTPAGVWPVWCRSAARCWCFCRMSPSSARQVLRGGGLCPPAQAAPACCLAAKWGTPCSAFLLPGGVKPLPPFPKQPLDWEEDIQLCSWFLDRKVRQGDKAIWGHGAVPLPAGSPLGCPGGTVGGQAGQHPPSPAPQVWKRAQASCPPPWHSGRGGTLVPMPTLPTPPQEELQASHATYIQQHPELRVLLADFLQALLLQQPCDPVSFAAQFFARQQPPGTPFASTVAASPPPCRPPANGE